MKILLIGFGNEDSSSSKLVSYIVNEIDDISIEGIHLAEPVNLNISKVKKKMSLKNYSFVIVIGEIKGLYKIDLKKVNYLYSLDEDLRLAIEWTNWINKWKEYAIPYIVSNYTGDTYKSFVTFGLNEYFITNKYSSNLISINIPKEWRIVETYKEDMLELFRLLF